MAWWTTKFTFRGNRLISEGIDLVPLDDYEVVAEEKVPARGAEQYTRVIVSGYALYGELRGYYALGVSHWYLDRGADRVYMNEASQRHTESVSSLTPTQRAVIRECLIDISPGAWENSNLLFRQKLGN